MDSQPTEKVEGVGKDVVRGGQDKTPTPKKSNSYERTVLKADTPTGTVTKRNGQYSAPWVVESPGGNGYDFGLQLFGEDTTKNLR
jgi:hypothetical protein